MSAVRTDVHRPSEINPADYEFVAIEAMKLDGLEACQAIIAERAILRAHMERTGGTYSGHAHGGNCHVCGNANAIYTALFFHAKTNSYIRMGQDCAGKCAMGGDSRFRKVRTQVEAMESAKAGKMKARGLLEEAGLINAWDIYTAPFVQGEREEEVTVRDIVGRLVRYGDVSAAQKDYLAKLIERIQNRAAIEAQRQAERADAKPAPTGRIKGEFEVVSVKTKDNGFGGFRIVMTVRAIEGGWLAWGTAPSGIERGARIAMSATFAPSESDNKFAFFKRPHIAEVVAEAVPA